MNQYYNLLLIIGSSIISISTYLLKGNTREDYLWAFFTFIGILILIITNYLDKKVDHSFLKTLYTVLSSFVVCYLIKLTYHEGVILSSSLMLGFTFIGSMIAPAFILIVIAKFPDILGNQLLRLPEMLVDLIKEKSADIFDIILKQKKQDDGNN